MNYEKTQRGHFLDLTHQGHRDWMRDSNPDGWDSKTWIAFNVRMGTDGGFRERVKQAAEDRHRWVDEHLAQEIGGRHVSGEVRMQFRRDLMRDAYEKFPRPNPWENDWQMPENADPLSAIGSRAKRSSHRLRSNRPPPQDSESLKAAREAYQSKVEREAEAEKGRAWS